MGGFGKVGGGERMEIVGGVVGRTMRSVRDQECLPCPSLLKQLTT